MGYARRRTESGQTVSCTTDVEVGDLVYLSASEVADRALANSPNTMPAIGIVVRKLSNTQCIINQYQLQSNLSGLTPKQKHFVSTTQAGKTQTTPPASKTGHVSQYVGESKSTTERLITIDATNYVIKG